MQLSSLFPPVLVVLSACTASPLSPGRDADVGIGGDGGVDVDDAGAGEVDTSGAGTSDAATAETGAPGHPLCDGMPHLRVAAAFVGGGTIARGSRVTIENGYRLFAVDGDCTYWIAAGWADETFSADRPIRTGKLSDADIRALEETLPLDDITSLENGCSQNSISDAPVRSIRAATGTAICGQGPAGARFEAAWTAVQTVATGLANAGTPVDGPLHVSAVPIAVVGTAISYPWPTSLALADFILDGADADKVGVSRLVDDPDAASQLRVMRDEYVLDAAVQPGLHPGGAPLATDQTVTVSVFMRDAIPYEDAQGLLAF
jgi:hypothetical protein